MVSDQEDTSWLKHKFLKGNITLTSKKWNKKSQEAGLLGITGCLAILALLVFRESHLQRTKCKQEEGKLSYWYSTVDRGTKLQMLTHNTLYSTTVLKTLFSTLLIEGTNINLHLTIQQTYSRAGVIIAIFKFVTAAYVYRLNQFRKQHL